MGTCKIKSYPLANTASDAFSVWEFIDGFHPEHSLGYFLQSSQSRAIPYRTALAEECDRLEQIAQAIRLSDLHGNNVLIRHVVPARSSLFCWPPSVSQAHTVAIDLEVRNYAGNNTDLYRACTHAPAATAQLNRQEKKLIRSFNEELKSCPARIVPLETIAFTNASVSYKEIETLREKIIEGLLSYSRLTITKEVLQEEITSVVKNGDVCYFGCERGLIYLEKSATEKIAVAQINDVSRTTAEESSLESSPKKRRKT